MFVTTIGQKEMKLKTRYLYVRTGMNPEYLENRIWEVNSISEILHKASQSPMEDSI